MARLGDTFLLRGFDKHLIIIISEPGMDANQIVTANFNLLERILYGAAVSPYIPLCNRQILVEQGLIDV